MRGVPAGSCGPRPASPAPCSAAPCSADAAAACCAGDGLPESTYPKRYLVVRAAGAGRPAPTDRASPPPPLY